MDWPENSPDLNPIDRLWHIMKCEVAEQKPANKSQLIQVLELVWYGAIKRKFKVLVNSTPSRNKEFIEAKGAVTRY